MKLYPRLLDRVHARRNTLMLSLAALIGVLGGLGSVGFRKLIQLAQRGAWGDWTYSLELVRAHPWWWIVLTPAMGGLVVGPLVFFLAREARGHGVPEVMEAVAVRSGFIRTRVVVVKSLASAITIGTGGSVGREGPIVQIGSAIGSAVGRWAGVSASGLRTLVGCGAAAGIAGTFNAPVAGALFAVEVILGDFGVAEFSPIVISAVLATAVSRHYLGDYPAFVVPPHELVSAWELGAYAVLGLVAAAVALAFMALLYGLEDGVSRLRVRPWLMPAAGGLLVGGLGVAFPEVLGVGYEATSAALMGQLGLGLVTVLVLVKMVATSVTLSSGGSGGVFAPSLFLGAMTGSLVGGLAHQWFPDITGGSGAYALVGMGAVVAGTTHAPITAILIIFEITSDYKLILPLMTSCIIAVVASSRGNRPSIYTRKLLRRGVDVFRGHELNLLRSVRAADVMGRDLVKVAEGRPLGEMLDLLSREPRSAYYVVDDRGRLTGVIRPSDLQETLAQAEALGSLIVAGDLAREDPRAVGPDTPLDGVMRTLADEQPDELAVVGDGGRVLGVVGRRHVLDAYNRELMKRDMATGMGSRLDATRATEMKVGQDYGMIEVDVPAGFIGRSLRSLDVRTRWGVQVLLVRRPVQGADGRRDLVPDGETVLKPGDRLVMLGPDQAVARFRA